MSAWAVPGYSESFELGAGASGRVVLAVHEETGVPVAVKYLSESLLTRPGFVTGFRAEARLLAGLDSPYVAGLYEYVESPDGAAIVMELVDGVSLRTLLSRQGPLDPEAALVVLKGSLLGLADAHRVGVVHRDYKPENVLVTPDGASRLVDFGIAVDSGTQVGVAGTPSYMAPEQWTGAPASPAADVYAATATFFECLTGHRPYSGDNLAELALRHVDAPVPVGEVPEPVRDLVLRGLAKDPAQRPGHAEQFVAELEAVAGAAYGPGWEERGRSRLAALAALLLLLLPSSRAGARTVTDTARTVLGRPAAPGGLRPWLPGRVGLLLSAAVLLLGVLLAYGAPSAQGTAAGQAAGAAATTSTDPGGGAGPGPGTPATPLSSPAPSATPTAPPSAAETTAAPTGTADPTATASAPPSPSAAPPSGGTTASSSPSVPVSAPPSATPAPAVKDITVSAFRQTGPSTASATIGVTTDGTGPVSVTVTWYAGDSPAGPGTPDGSARTFRRSGATRYTLDVDHTFQGTGCYWTVSVVTAPASADGGASQQLMTRQCEIR